MLKKMVALTSCLIITACTTVSESKMATVDYVDLERFMGAWYVIANIPTSMEKGAHNAVESYRLDNDGTIDTTFTFRKGSFEGPEKMLNPRGFIINKQTNAEWGMRFIWPFKAEYLVIYLAPDYSTAVIGRSARDYVWIMSRTPRIPDVDYERILTFIEDTGYDISLIQKVPQQWD